MPISVTPMNKFYCPVPYAFIVLNQILKPADWPYAERHRALGAGKGSSGWSSGASRTRNPCLGKRGNISERIIRARVGHHQTKRGEAHANQINHASCRTCRKQFSIRSRRLGKDAGTQNAECDQIDRAWSVGVCARTQNAKRQKIHCPWCFRIRARQAADDRQQQTVGKVSLSSFQM
jgi:hypothetical protein